MCYMVATGLYCLRLHIFHNIFWLIYTWLIRLWHSFFFFLVFVTRTSFMTFSWKLTPYIYIYNSNFARMEIRSLFRHFSNCLFNLFFLRVHANICMLKILDFNKKNARTFYFISHRNTKKVIVYKSMKFLVWK